MYIEPNTYKTYQITDTHNNERLDAALAELTPLYSRSFFQKAIADGLVTLNGVRAQKSNKQLKAGDSISVFFPQKNRLVDARATDDFDVEVIFEHRHFLIINKPAGLVVHAPSAASTEPALVDWLMNRYADIATVGPQERAGIVHRLDKNTSGIMIIPRTDYALAQFGTLFKDRKIHKTYHALVVGKPDAQGIIDYPIDRHRTEPTKMTHLYGTGRDALTFYETKEYYTDGAFLELKPVTGRTHQIRVHCTAIGHPLIGDVVYGTASSAIGRHALHAYAISFTFEGTSYAFTAQAPQDFVALRTRLAHD